MQTATISVSSTKEAFKDTLKTFLQIFLSRVSTSGSSFAIATYVALLADEGGTLDTATLGSSGLIQALSLLTIVWMASMMYATGPLLANALGQKDIDEETRKKKLVALVQQGECWALLSMPVTFLSVVSLPWWLPAVGQNSEVVSDVQQYFSGAIWAIPASFLQVPLQMLAFAHKDKPLTIGISALQLGLTIGVGYLFAFSFDGGIEGLGYAQAFRVWVGFGCYAVAMRKRAPYCDYPLFVWQGWQKEAFANIGHTGWPIAVLRATELFTLTIVMLLVGSLSTEDLASQKIVSQWLSLFFVIPFSLLQSGRFLVSHAIGESSDAQYADAKRYGWVTIVCGVAFTLPTSLAMLCAPESFVRWFVTPSEDASLFALATNVVRFGGGIHLCDGIRMSAAGALQGWKHRTSKTFDVKGSTLLNAASVWGIGVTGALVAVFAADGVVLDVNICLLVAMAVASTLLPARWVTQSQGISFWQDAQKFSSFPKGETVLHEPLLDSDIELVEPNQSNRLGKS